MKFLRLLNFTFFSLFCVCALLQAEETFLDPSVKGMKKTIMIDPAGHAGDIGRSLRNGFERAATFKLAQELQSAFEKRRECRVILTRVPGEKIVDFQNASFANRLNVDLFVGLHIFKQNLTKPSIYLYHYVSDPVGDFFRRNFSNLRFISVLEAHKVNIFKTKQICEKIKQTFLSDEKQRIFDFYGIFGIPLKPLCGVIAPAILFEIGVNRDDDWKFVVDSIVEGLNLVI